ncbi:MAG TPA: hypothetical protein VH744_13035 [Terriglobales bacterium]|jgi:hypothetical protein
MTELPKRKSWILEEKRVRVTTWKFRLVALLAAVSLFWVTYPAWLVAIGDSLLHEQRLEPADVILLENYDTEYAVYETAHSLVQAGLSSRVLVPVRTEQEAPHIDAVEIGFAEVLSRAAGINNWEILPVKHIEPVSLNVARQIADFFERNSIRSVIVVSPGFRSARSYLVYSRVFTPRGIRIECHAAATRGVTPATWWHTWHGIQNTGLEFAKLLYYRFWVLQRV